MFGAISPWYDFLNHFLSLGIDVYWRQSTASEFSENGSGKRYLDVATGTGDLAFELARNVGEKSSVVGMDFCQPMVVRGRKKWDRIWSRNTNGSVPYPQDPAETSPPIGKVLFHCGDALQLPFSDRTFDGATCAFGVRNFSDLKQGLTEIRRVLKPDAKFVVLEFSTPENPLFRFLYRFYSHRVLPWIGRLVSRHPTAYTYLPESVDQFPAGKEFQRELESTGFRKVGFRSLTMGIVTIHTGIRTDP